MSNARDRRREDLGCRGLAMAHAARMLDRLAMAFLDPDDPILLSNQPPRRERVLGVSR